MTPLLSLRHYHRDVLCHSHDHPQLVFGLSGLLDFEVAGHGCRVARQTLAVVPARFEHACDSRHGSRCLVLDLLSRSWLQEQLGEHADAGLRLLDTPGARTLDPVQDQLVVWLASAPLHDPLIARQGAALLMASLSASNGSGTGAVRGLPLAAIDAYIDRHAAHPLQVGDLARLANLSAARLHARFQQETGHTPMDYVRARRLALARNLLLGTRLSMGEIASRVGYQSQSAFSAAFARYFGLTPTAQRSRDE